MRFIDSHVHLSDYRDPALVLAFASSTGMLLFASGIGEESSRRSLSLAKGRSKTLRPFVGVHPSEAEREGFSWVFEALGWAAGIGEIGLDPKYSPVSRGGAQAAAFEHQLGLAERSGKPVQVHSRGAEREVFGTISAYGLKSVQLHWFQGDELVADANEKGYFASFGPALLFSKKLQRMAATWNREKVMVESDGPVGFAALGGSGGPMAVPSVVFKLAQIMGLSFVDAAELVLSNSLAFLGEKA